MGNSLTAGDSEPTSTPKVDSARKAEAEASIVNYAEGKPFYRVSTHGTSVRAGAEANTPPIFALKENTVVQALEERGGHVRIEMQVVDSTPTEGWVELKGERPLEPLESDHRLVAQALALRADYRSVPPLRRPPRPCLDPAPAPVPDETDGSDPENNCGWLRLRDGLRVPYRYVGAERAPLVLLIVGSNIDLRAQESISSVSNFAADGRFRVLTYDLRGQGRAMPPAAGYRHIAEFADDAVELVDAVVGPQARFHLVAHSLGSTIADWLRRRHPERVAAAIFAGVGSGNIGFHQAPAPLVAPGEPFSFSAEAIAACDRSLYAFLPLTTELDVMATSERFRRLFPIADRRFIQGTPGCYPEGVLDSVVGGLAEAADGFVSDRAAAARGIRQLQEAQFVAFGTPALWPSAPGAPGGALLLVHGSFDDLASLPLARQYAAAVGATVEPVATGHTVYTNRRAVEPKIWRFLETGSI